MLACGRLALPSELVLLSPRSPLRAASQPRGRVLTFRLMASASPDAAGAVPETFSPFSEPEALNRLASNRLASHRPAPLAPPPPPVGAAAWTDEVWASPVSLTNRVFCNRSLNMKSITAVGFDMDYTLAQYIPETFEALAYSQAVETLVSKLAYPADVLSFRFDPNYMVRGLAVDKVRGNVLKMDRHKYVKLAFHGFTELSREQRLGVYAEGPLRESYDEPEYALLDTLFSLGETFLFCQLVEWKDAHPEVELPAYARMHKDVRTAVDMCHRDGSLKRVVASDPARFIYADPNLVPLLEMLRASGRKTFIVTNSLWDYTHVVMNYLCDGRVGADKRLDWLARFDCVITGSAKPSFFENERASIFAVDPATGHLRNTDNGAPLPHVGGDDPLAAGPPCAAPELLEACEEAEAVPTPPRIFQGGCYRHLHAMLGIASGSRVLYVGDHIYGDILRSKKTLGWRTALVVPELAAELRVLAQKAGAGDEFAAMRATRDSIDDELQRLTWAHRSGGARAAAAGAGGGGGGGGGDGAGAGAGRSDALASKIAALSAERDALREVHRARLKEYHGAFHPVWGQLMKTGYANSRFASQVERFACLYTSHVGNLLAYSPDKSYRKSEDWLAHERTSPVRAEAHEKQQQQQQQQ